MGWVRVDDDFYDHPKFLDLSLEAIGLWVALLAWSNRNLRDGAIPHTMIRRFGADDILVAELVDSGLLERADDGVLVIHDYHDFQPSADDVQAKRQDISAKRADAGRKGAASRWQTDSKPEATSWPQPQPQENKPIRAAKAAPIPEEDFADWWAGWPKKLDKATAAAQYRARRRQGIPADVLIAARDNYVRSKAGDLEHMKYPATFLHGPEGPWSEFTDGIPAAARGNGQRGPTPQGPAYQEWQPGSA